MRPSDVIELKKLMAVVVPVLQGEFDVQIKALEETNAKAELLGDLKKREEALLERESTIRHQLDTDEKLLADMRALQAQTGIEVESFRKEKESYKLEREAFIAEQAAAATEFEQAKADFTKLQSEFDAKVQTITSEQNKRSNELEAREKAVNAREVAIKQAAAAIR